MLINIDDMLIVGKSEAVCEAIQVLQQSFEVKPPTTIEDLGGGGGGGGQVIKRKYGEKAWLGKPTIIKRLEKIFDEDVKTLQTLVLLGKKLWMKKIR